ncbi:serine hydrolase [Cyanobium sp. ATX 6A2]|uniref:serine hydrolase n=1 Tax=Cyanobium sp. ATX 6A2 TaxID=2823700 RepID=UPI0020CC8CFE|nr:serine hydrolase [Cyanobium sp. ATX 6A2]
MSAAQSPRPPRNRWRQTLLLLLRLAVMGVGLGVLAGTGLRLLAPRLAEGNLPSFGQLAEAPEQQSLAMGRFQPRQEITELSERWQQLAAAQKDLKATGFLLVLDDGRFAQLGPDQPMPAASSIKTPILVVALEDLDSGKLSWNDPLQLTQELVGGGAGWMATRPLGTRFPFREAATEMIRVSDNSATNLVIQKLGGQAAVNARFQTMGLSATQLNNWLPDLDGTNTSSARDLARSIALVDTGETLGPRARDHFREIMASSGTDTLIPQGLLQGLGKNAEQADPELLSLGITALNKTGDIGTAYADAALIQLPNGQRAVAAFMVTGPFNDPRSAELIRGMAAAVSQTLVGRP